MVPVHQRLAVLAGQVAVEALMQPQPVEQELLGKATAAVLGQMAVIIRVVAGAVQGLLVMQVRLLAPEQLVALE